MSGTLQIQARKEEKLAHFSVPVVFSCFKLWISNKQGMNVGQALHCLFQVYNKLWCVAYRVLFFIHRYIKNWLLSVWPVNKWCFLKKIHHRFWHDYFSLIKCRQIRVLQPAHSLQKLLDVFFSLRMICWFDYEFIIAPVPCDKISNLIS